MTYQAWMKKVDIVLGALVGLGARDLADCCWHDMFEGGYTPAEAAKEALESDGTAGDALVEYLFA